jgi:thiamine-phosphate pyrophosphorylase
MVRSPLIAMVTDRRRYGDDPGASESLVGAGRQAAAAGVDLIHVREFGLDDGRLVNLVAAIVEASTGSACQVVVNARADVALAARAHGVHLRGTSPSAARVRQVVGAGFLIGRSVHSVEEAEIAEASGGCDYLVFGTVFPSVSKAAGHPIAGIEALAQVCARVRLPVLGIGGVTAANAGQVAASGAAGVAAIDLFAALPTADDRIDAAASWSAVVTAIRAAFTRA